MSGVCGTGNCPICRGETETYFETRTAEHEIWCCEDGRCGYTAFTEIKEVRGRLFWVETEWFPMANDRRVARPGGEHKWTRKEFGGNKSDDSAATADPDIELIE